MVFSNTSKAFAIKEAQTRYFGTQDKAEKALAEFKAEREEHGKQAVSSDERRWIGFARQQLGDLDLLPEVIAHWRKTGSAPLVPTTSDTSIHFLNALSPNH